MNEARKETPETIPPRRCAIYTRVAVDGDPLNPNSLQAQEEICRTLIDCRTFEATAEAKWIHTETYADSSCSGATLQRPALERLLADLGR